MLAGLGSDLAAALGMPTVFDISLSVANDTAPACNLPPPCFAAEVRVTVPEAASAGAVKYTVAIDSNSRVVTTTANAPGAGGNGGRACLFSSARNSLRPAAVL